VKKRMIWKSWGKCDSDQFYTAFGEAKDDLLIETDLVAEDSVDAGHLQGHAQQIRQPSEEVLPSFSDQPQGRPVEWGLKASESGVKVGDRARRWKPGQTAVLPVAVLGAGVEKEGLAGAIDFRLENRNSHKKAQGHTGAMRRRGCVSKDHDLPRDIEDEMKVGEDVHAEESGTGFLHEDGKLFGRQAAIAGRNRESSVADNQAGWLAEALGSSGVDQPRLAIDFGEEVSLRETQRKGVHAQQPLVRNSSKSMNLHVLRD